MSDSKEDKAKLKALLKKLRSERGNMYEQARAKNKEIKLVRAKVKKALAVEPKSVPSLASELEIPSEDVLWHLMAMRKYGAVAEGEPEDDYFRYRLVADLEKGK
jgi:hypothetical protein